MIGVAVQPAERESAAEFFELFKTPWTFIDASAPCDVLISTGGAELATNAKAVLLFSDQSQAFDRENRLAARPRAAGAVISHAGRRLFLHGPLATFPSSQTGLAREEASQEPVMEAVRTGDRTVIRIGYNLFAETRNLLSSGQSTAWAGTPTLEFHIALVRDLITRAGLPVVEIPPAPAGHPFIACLTHDMDHPALRNHRGDHTMFGFIHRALFGSVVKFCRGRMPLGSLWENWKAVALLPFIHLGLARDIWLGFDRYLEIEAGLGATYFFLPRRGDPGRTRVGPAPDKRACRYDLARLAPQVQKIVAAGNEVGLHGLDAWREAGEGRREREQMLRAAGIHAAGTRMHWLYFDGDAPAALDEAGFEYDSTVGYNNAVGYRAGTAQAYRPPGTRTLLELPLLAMDTALFYPDHLNLSDGDALRIMDALLDSLEQFGGAFTVNWHDRSIAPERLWTGVYEQLLRRLKDRGAWFPTAARAVAWFRKRRMAAVESVGAGAGRLQVRVRLDKPDDLPSLTLRVHKPCRRLATEPLATGPAADFVDSEWNATAEFSIAL